MPGGGRRRACAGGSDDKADGFHSGGDIELGEDGRVGEASAALSRRSSTAAGRLGRAIVLADSMAFFGAVLGFPI